MPKAEKGSVKDIAKRIKAKGLQRLKFFCQMCEKQCRDANGFKCHIQSESHLRQMKLFSENASGIMDQYSREFEKVYLDTLRMLHGTAHVNANNVYQQVIRDKQHIHMNSTIWASLSDFVQYLGKTGKCKVEETERGWYLTYINRDVNLIVRQQEAEKRLEAEQQAEAELAKRLEERRKEASLAFDRAGFQNLEATNLERRKDDETINISLAVQTQESSNAVRTKKKKKIRGNALDAGSDSEDEKAEESSQGNVPPPPPFLPQPGAAVNDRKRSAPNSTNPIPPSKHSKTNEKASTASANHKANVWLYRDIVVRIISKDYMKGRYFRRKAYVDRVSVKENSVSAELTLIPKDKDTQDENNDDENDVVLTLAQDELETVIPKRPESRVRILKGDHRGKKATVLALNKKEYRARLELSNGTVLQDVDFEDFAEMA